MPLAATSPRPDHRSGHTSDGNGNITCLLDGSQAIAASYRYDPFGNTISASGPLADANIYRFSSKEVHPQSGLYYYGYRWYSPNLQRWISRDPISEYGGINLYAYTRNMQTGAIDPLGRQGGMPAPPPTPGVVPVEEFPGSWGEKEWMYYSPWLDPSDINNELNHGEVPEGESDGSTISPDGSLGYYIEKCIYNFLWPKKPPQYVPTISPTFILAPLLPSEPGAPAAPPVVPAPFVPPVAPPSSPVNAPPVIVIVGPPPPPTPPTIGPR